MKTLLFICLLLLSIASQAQTTTAQTALKTFEDAWITVNFTGMTTTQKNTHIASHYALKIAAVKEIEANRIIAENQAIADAATRRNQAITYLTNHGFKCDNSEFDWDRLYNRPKYFGDNWKVTADYQRSISPNVDYFIAVAYDLYLTYIKNRD